jgi:hypothetical protein
MQILLSKKSMASQGLEVGDSTSLKPRIYCHRYWKFGKTFYKAKDVKKPTRFQKTEEKEK